MVKLSKEEGKKFKKECNEWKDYKSLDDYKKDILVCLVFSSWGYSEDGAMKRIASEENYIKEAFDQKEPANLCSAEVGYVAG